MDKLVVTESPPLTGTVPISGAKNAVLPILAALAVALIADYGQGG